MTKTNKTLLCALLALVLTLACALTIMPTVTTVHAADESVVVDFSKDEYSTTMTKGSAVLLFDKGKGNYEPTLNTGLLRFYASNTFSVTSTEKKVVKIVFTFGSTKYLGELSSDNGAYSVSGTVGTWTGSANTVVFTSSKQARIKTIAITLEEEAAVKITPTINNQQVTKLETEEYMISLTAGESGFVVGGTFTVEAISLVDGRNVIVQNGKEILSLADNGKYTGTIGNELNITIRLEVVCDHATLTKVEAVEATCASTGLLEHYKCANDECGKLFDKNTDDKQEITLASVTIPKKAHVEVYKNVSDGKHEIYCSVCNEVIVADENCTGGIATCKEKAVCEKCNTEYGKLADHNFVDGTCSVCGIAVPSYKKVMEAPTDWSGTYVLVYENSGTEAYVWTGVDAVNCFTKATIENGKISGEFVTLTIAALDKGYSILLNGGTNNGNYVYRSKSDNGLDIAKTQGVNTISINGNSVEIVSGGTTLKFNNASNQLRFRYYTSGQQPVQLYKLVPAAHKHVEGDGIVTKAATCKENGEMTYKCTICGEVVRTDVIAKTTEHTYNDGEITTAATCTATGVKTFTCTVCGETKTQEIEALGHDFHGEETVEDATCVKTGTKIVQCTRCDELEETELPIDENAHKWGEAAHIEGTETHKFTCAYDPTHTKIENCTYVEGLCSECLAEKPATEDKFAIVESIAAGENTVEKDGVLYVKAGSRVIVTYTITANSGVDVIEATLKQNAKFTFVSMTAGTLNNASATVTGTDVESAVKKIVVTAEKGGFTQSNVVLMTVVYELATDVTENEIPEFGIELTVLNGNTELAADKVTFTAHQTKFAVRSSELPAITVNGKTSSEEIHLTYKGEAYTSSDFAIAGRTDTPTIEWTDVANVGKYTLTLKFADNGTYGEQTVTFTVVIDKVALKASDFEIKLAEGASLTKKLVSGSVSWSKADFAVTIAEGKLVGSDTLATIGGLDGTDCTLTEARSQTLIVEFVLLSDNYTLDGKVSKQFTVTAEKTDLTFGGIAIADNASKYYDGNTENVGTITVSDGSNVIEAVVNVTITKDGTAVNEILHAGKYVITIATALTDEQKKDYEDISTTINYTVNKLTIVGITFAYDGNVVTWAATKCYSESADALVDLVAAGDVVYKVNGETVSEYKIVADGSARNYTVTLEATEDYILSNEVKTATTVDVHTVTFVDEKHTNVSKYVFDGQKVTADTPATVDGWTFNGWFADGAETAYDFSKITADVSVVARWTASVTLTVKDVYQGKTFDKQNTLTTVGGTLLGEVSGLAEMQINASWLKLEGYYSDEQCTVKVTTVENQTNVTIYAKYELAIGLGDVDGDGNVGNSDIVLYRQYIVGGYKITVVEAGKEYEEASKTLAEGYVRFFAAVANVDGVEGSANDIRDIATLRMAMVEQDGYKVVGGAVVAPEKTDSGNTETQAVNTKIENRIYALLPTTFGVGKAA